MAKSGNAVYALAGLGMVIAGIPALLFGIASLVGGSLFGILFPWMGSGLISFFQVFGIAALIAGLIMSWLGTRLAAENGGKLLRITLGVIAFLAAIVSAILAVLLIETIIGTVIFLFAMVFFLIVMDWGFNVKFFSKFLEAIPVIGKATVWLIKLPLPKTK